MARGHRREATDFLIRQREQWIKEALEFLRKRYPNAQQVEIEWLEMAPKHKKYLIKLKIDGETHRKYYPTIRPPPAMPIAKPKLRSKDMDLL